MSDNSTAPLSGEQDGVKPLPCPFCGNAPYVAVAGPRAIIATPGEKFVECITFDCPLYGDKFAWEAWNRRSSSPDGLTAPNAALKTAIAAVVEVGGCGDHSCLFATKPPTIGTNGGCRCRNRPKMIAALSALVRAVCQAPSPAERAGTPTDDEGMAAIGREMARMHHRWQEAERAREDACSDRDSARSERDQLRASHALAVKEIEAALVHDVQLPSSAASFRRLLATVLKILKPSPAVSSPEKP